jgi:hypothetical protein
MFHIIW